MYGAVTWQMVSITDQCLQRREDSYTKTHGQRERGCGCVRPAGMGKGLKGDTFKVFQEGSLRQILLPLVQQDVAWGSRAQGLHHRLQRPRLLEGRGHLHRLRG